MPRINLPKVLVGGLVAGLVINISQFILNMGVIADESAAAMQRMGVPEPGGAAITIYVILGFLIGILLVWLYAAIRPRFGPGPSTAVLAGLVMWAVWYGFRMIDFMAAGTWPRNLLILAIVWGFVEMIIAALVGGWLYKEETA
jgi:hypothetical protein